MADGEGGGIASLLGRWSGGGAVVAPYCGSDSAEARARSGVTLAFLLDFYDSCVAPLPGGPSLRTADVVSQVVAPATRAAHQPLAALVPRAVGAPHAFASHAFHNPFALLVATLRDHYADAVAAEVFVWVDIFAINQHDPAADMHGGRTLERTVALSGVTLVVLDRTALPLTRLWCLYEIGSTPPDKLRLLHPGASDAEVVAACRNVDVAAAECFDSRDTARIREHIVAQHGSLAALQRTLRLRLLLRPVSYEADVAALLSRADAPPPPPLLSALRAHLDGVRDGEASVCAAVVGGPGEGKSTLAAALCGASPPLAHARHFFSASDVRRQDVGAVLRSLAYQLGLALPPVGDALLALHPNDAVRALRDPRAAWQLLLRDPLGAAPQRARVTVLLDALDEAEAAPGDEGDDDDSPLRLLARLAALRVDVVVTTRPLPGVLAALRRAWPAPALLQLAPADFLFAPPATQAAPMLMRALARAGRVGTSLDDAYAATFAAEPQPAGADGAPPRLLAVLLAARQPPSMAQLQALGLRDALRALPAWGLLFYERDYCVHLLHKSLADWLVDDTRSGPFAVDTAVGHAIWAHHLWVPLSAWLYGGAPAPPRGSYAYAHAMAHLDAAGRAGDARRLLLQLSWLQALLRELGIHGLLAEIGARMVRDAADADDNAAALAVLHRLLRLALPGLTGNDADKALPLQLEGRLLPLLCDSPHAAAPQVPDAIVSLFEEARACGSGAVRVRIVTASLQAPSGALQARIELSGADTKAMAVLDAHRLLTASRGALRIWNLNTGRCERTLECGGCARVGGAAALCVLAEVAITGGPDGNLRLWNLRSGACERTMEGHADRVTCTTVLAGGGGCADLAGRVLSGGGNDRKDDGDAALRLWDVQTGTCLRTMVGHKRCVTAVIQVPERAWAVSGGTDAMLCVWDLLSGACLRTLDEADYSEDGRFVCATLLRDGRVLTGNNSGMYLWDIEAGKLVTSLDAKEPPRCILELCDGRVVTGGDLALIRVWRGGDELRRGADPEPLSQFTGHANGVRMLLQLPDGRVVSAADDVCVWDMEDAGAQRSSRRHNGRVYQFARTPDGRVVSSASDYTLAVWDAATGACLHANTKDTYVPDVWEPVGFAPVVALGACRVVTMTCYHLQVWDAYTGERCTDEFEQLEHICRGPVVSLLAVSAERVLASRRNELDPVLELLDVVAQQLVTSWSAPAVYSSLALLPLDGGQAQSLVAAGRCGLRGRIAEGTACIDIWDLTVGACVRSFSAGHTSSVHELRVLPAAAHADGAAQCARLLSSSYRDRTHRVWDLQSGTCLLTVSFDDANGVQDAADTRIGVPLSTDRHVFIPRAGGVYLDSKVTATMAFQHSVEGEQEHTVVCVGTKSGAVHIFRTECASVADAAVQRAARRAEAPREAGHGHGAYES